MSLREDAESGIYFTLTCAACRRKTQISAKALSEAGHGDRRLIDLQPRLRCEGCGARGSIGFIVTGYWTGPWESRPADWAASVESRMRP